MKSQTLNLALLFAVLALAVTVWRFMPEPAVDDLHELVDTRPQPKANNARSESPAFSTGPDRQGSSKPELTKSTIRYRTGHSPQDGKHEPAAKPNASKRQNNISKRVLASARESLLDSPLPTPAVFIALDPSASGISAAHEPEIQAMAEQAEGVLKEYAAGNQLIEEQTELSAEEKQSAWLDLRESAYNQIQAIDHVFRAKYGTRAWIAHHVAAHREFDNEK